MCYRKILWAFLAAWVLTACGDDDFPVPPASTVPNFSFTLDNDGFAPATARFTNTSIIPEEAGSYTVQWVFGDGTTSAQENPEHTYQQAGTYTAVLTLVTQREIATVERRVVVQNPSAIGIRVYYGDRTSESVRLALINEDDPAPVPLPMDPVSRPYSIAADTVNGKLYIADFGAGFIYRADPDGRNREVFRSELAGPAGLGIDYANGMLYWTTDTGVQRGSLNSSDQVEDFVTGQATDPEGLAISPTNNAVYWVNYDGGLWRKPFSGGNETELVPNVLGACVVIANETVYYHSFDLGASQHTIKVVDLSGNPIRTLASGMDGDVYGMFYEPGENKVYWTDQRAATIRRANADGSGQEVWLADPGTRLYGMALGSRLE